MGNVATPLLVVCGLKAEARIAAGPGVVTLCGGGDAVRLEAGIAAALERGVAGVLSFGIAGGLDLDLPVGAAVLARIAKNGGETCPVDPQWLERLQRALPAAVIGSVCGVDRAAATVACKAALARETGALAVDMESHIAAKLAFRHGVPFAALRVISDDAAHALPSAALAGMRADGGTDVVAVLRALWRAPGQLPALLRTARDAGRAFAALRAARGRVGAGFGLTGG